MEIVDLTKHRDDEDKKTMECLKEQLGELMKTIDDGRLQQLVIQYDEKTAGEDAEIADEARHIIFWNNDENFDEMVGFVQRLLFRITLIAESAGK